MVASLTTLGDSADELMNSKEQPENKELIKQTSQTMMC